MGANNLAAGIHEVLHAACHSPLLGGCLFCLNHGVINLVVSLNLDKLIGTIYHLCKEVGIVLANSARFWIVVVYGEITLIGSKHSREVNLCNFAARDVLHKAFLLWDGIEAVCV